MNIQDSRNKINKIDDEIIKLFQERMISAEHIAEYKKKNNLPVFDKKREQEILEKIAEKSSPEFKDFSVELYEKIFELSRRYQEEIIG